jgi:hypothetical protein
VTAPPGADPIGRRIGVVGHPRYAASHDTVQGLRAFAERLGIELIFEPELAEAGFDGPALGPADFAAARPAAHARRRRHAAARRADGGLPASRCSASTWGTSASSPRSARRSSRTRSRAVSAGGSCSTSAWLSPRAGAAADGTSRGSYLALNDVVLHRGGVARMIRWPSTRTARRWAPTARTASSSPPRPARPPTRSPPAAPSSRRPWTASSPPPSARTPWPSGPWCCRPRRRWRWRSSPRRGAHPHDRRAGGRAAAPRRPARGAAGLHAAAPGAVPGPDLLRHAPSEAALGRRPRAGPQAKAASKATRRSERDGRMSIG